MGTTDDVPHGFAADETEHPECPCETGNWELGLVLSPRWAVPLRGHFSYRADDPYAVCLDFYLDTRNPVRWIFARDLLTTGLIRPAGHADVRVWPALNGLVNLCLNSHDGEALFEISETSLIEWLERTYQLVPPGREHHFLDLDSFLERLMRES